MLISDSLYYHWTRIALFNFLKTPGAKFEHTAEVGGGISRYAREQCVASARTIASIQREYIRRCGCQNPTMSMPQTALSTAYLLIEDLDEPGVHDIFFVAFYSDNIRSSRLDRTALTFSTMSHQTSNWRRSGSSRSKSKNTCSEQ